MGRPIDLRLNYPLLPNQDLQFKDLVNSAISEIGYPIGLTPTGGSAKDREIAAVWLSQPGYTIDAMNSFLGGGGHHLCLVSLLAANLQNKTVAVENFTYSNFVSLARLLNINLIPCETDSNGIIPTSLEDISKSQRIDGLYIQPTVNNPLGTVMPLLRRKEIVEIARKQNLIIIEDDAYGFLEENYIPNFFHLAPERSFYIYSLSKPFGQAIRSGYLLAPDFFGDRVIEALRLTNTNLTWVQTWILKFIIENGLLRSLIQQKQKEGSFRQLTAKKLLKEFPLSGHKNGWHLWLHLPENIRASFLQRQLGDHGVTIVPSTSFAVALDPYDGAIRIALGGEQDFDRVIQGIEIIKETIKSCAI